VTQPANYVVAYEATDRGKDAVALGVALARLTAAELRIVLVLPFEVGQPAKAAPAASTYFSLLQAQGEEWLAVALALVPGDVTATAHIVWADTTSEGLIQAATDFHTDRIVVGAGRGGMLGRYSIGSVANALLHASPVPVALAPAGYVSPAAISRITCAIGTRKGWAALLGSMVAISDGLDVPLRFVTLVEVDASRKDLQKSAGAIGKAHLVEVLDHFNARASGSGSVTTEIAEGTSLEAAVDALDWRKDEIVFVGSSRLAQRGRIFLGTTASRMLHALPVPLIVVPIEKD
jgi:nucleotide-binding universal stress UspA family protein